MKKIILSVVLLLAGANANALILECVQFENPGKEMLILSTNETGTPILEVIDPASLQPLAHLSLWPNTVNHTSRIISVDHWESHVGAVQLIAVYDAGTFKSKHVYFDASFGRDRDNRGGYGMKKLNELSAAKLNWVCEEK